MSRPEDTDHLQATQNADRPERSELRLSEPLGPSLLFALRFRPRDRSRTAPRAVRLGIRFTRRRILIPACAGALPLLLFLFPLRVLVRRVVPLLVQVNGLLELRSFWPRCPARAAIFKLAVVRCSAIAHEARPGAVRRGASLVAAVHVAPPQLLLSTREHKESAAAWLSARTWGLLRVLWTLTSLRSQRLYPDL